MSDEISEIRARIDIVDLIGQAVALKRKGKSFLGLCPFHEDHNPSFNVSPDMGRYTCWSCKESGDIFSWVMKTQNVTFPEALQILAEKAGVHLRRQNDGDRSIRANQRAAMEAALSFFREQLFLPLFTIALHDFLMLSIPGFNRDGILLFFQEQFLLPFFVIAHQKFLDFSVPRLHVFGMERSEST